MNAGIGDTIARLSCLLLAFVPAMAGCHTILPQANIDWQAAPTGSGATPDVASGPMAVPVTVVRAAREDSPSASPGEARIGKIVTVASANEPAQEPVRVSFNQAVQTTLLADPKIRAGLEVVNQAKADLVTSSLFPNPSLTTDGIFLPLRSFTLERPGGPPQMDVIVGYPIDWFLFGKRTAAMASAGLGVKQSEADYAELIRQRVLACAQAFYDVVEARELLKLTREDLANLTKVEALTARAAQAGNRSKVDLQRVRLDMLRSEQAVREAESALAVAKARLQALMGFTHPDPSFDVEADIDAPLTAELVPLEEAYTLAQANRPDIQSLRWQVSKAQADTVVEHRKAFPSVSPSLGFSRQFQSQVLEAPDASSWQVALNMSVPLFDRNQGNRLKSRAVLAQNGFNLESGLIDLRTDVTQAYQDFDTAQKNALAIAQDQKKAAKDVLDAITKSYEAVGGRPFVDVLDAQRAYRDIYRAYISSRANYWRAVYRFSAALGKQITLP